ncbi:MAG: hypothetical protein ACI9V1_001235 [Spirosomataceae bacterium]|jgi:hypothetical protein
MKVTYDDKDKNGDPIGLTTDIVTSTASTGKLSITLQQKPKKNAPGVAEGNITNTDGATDSNVVFEVDIK